MVSEVERVRLVAHLRWQANGCESLGSAFYAALLRHLADDVMSDGITARVLSGHREDLREAALSLRLLGGVHRLVLSGAAPRLGAHYPSVGGDGDAEAASVPFVALLTEQESAVRDALGRAPQTNEVGRAAPLVGALCHLVDARPLPIRLFEIGTSAGLNLRCDRFEISTDDDRSFGPSASPVRLSRAWRGRVPPMGRSIQVIERAGCDPHPLDPTTDDDALTLTSYVWPDTTERFERLRGALAIAREVPARVERAGAADFLERAVVKPGSWLVVWHSVMWQYVGAAEQQAVLSRLDELGAAATTDAPLAHVTFEPRAVDDGFEFQVTVQTWPEVGLGDGERVLGTAPPWGTPVDWA